MNPDKINWYMLSQNPNAIHMLEKNQDRIDWGMLSQNPNAIHMLEKNQDRIVWSRQCTIRATDEERRNSRCECRPVNIGANKIVTVYKDARSCYCASHRIHYTNRKRELLQLTIPAMSPGVIVHLLNDIRIHKKRGIGDFFDLDEVRRSDLISNVKKIAGDWEKFENRNSM
jgi:hypothetical protein